MLKDFNFELPCEIYKRFAVRTLFLPGHET